MPSMLRKILYPILFHREVSAVFPLYGPEQISLEVEVIGVDDPPPPSPPPPSPPPPQAVSVSKRQTVNKFCFLNKYIDLPLVFYFY